MVFLIGMRVNNWLRWRDWLPVARAMEPMVRYLYQHPESGFLGANGPFLSLNFRETVMVQYWRSTEDLERFARQEPDLHPEAWKQFFRQSFKGGAVGIWHETYQVEAGAFENVYINMPPYGLAQATKAVKVRGRLESMRGRMSEAPSEAQVSRA
ncbi:DUF4188 domain-containing protein [Meiothermus sp. PNK-Is4]|uniref:DUF4188 domain-containing protein n=1 Tax=Meiothermus sp. PNK-Is4 TaxID=2740565 RepID=UPI001C2C2EDB|nr:DUF4188 domain-containing protein [Meiothermus sp. PNK-Is4]